jgi:hypothetical protein
MPRIQRKERIRQTCKNYRRPFTKLLKARRLWIDVVQALKQNIHQSRLLYIAKISFKVEE